MTFYQREIENIVEILAKAFTDNGMDELRKVLAKHSTYESEYNTNLSLIAGQEEIIKHISDN